MRRETALITNTIAADERRSKGLGNVLVTHAYGKVVSMVRFPTEVPSFANDSEL